jgi:hypothetical protein
MIDVRHFQQAHTGFTSADDLNAQVQILAMFPAEHR